MLRTLLCTALAGLTLLTGGGCDDGGAPGPGPDAGPPDLPRSDAPVTGFCTTLTEVMCKAGPLPCVWYTDCPGCDGLPTRAYCFEAGARMPCPVLDCQPPAKPGIDACRTRQDCNTALSELCVPPGTPTPCGICNMPEQQCGQDADCRAIDPTTICEVDTARCGCVPECLPGCESDGACGPGLTCQKGRCQPAPCSGDGECPANFACSSSGGSGQRCLRMECDVDEDCSGFCVERACYPQPGSCRGPVP